MDRQATTATPSLKRELEEEAEDQNGTRKVFVIEDKNGIIQALPRLLTHRPDLFPFSVQTNSTTIPSFSVATSKHRWRYDVFVSFRGKDTRKSFTDHLFTALEQAGINYFIDNDDHQRGNDIPTELANAIQRSMIFIVVFSKRYASSRWCLDELVKIINRCENTTGKTLLPIFYHVDPSDVRNQTGTFAKAFKRHEKKFQNDMERVKRWRTALTEAANSFGWDLDVVNGYESKLIAKIVKKVLRQMSSAGKRRKWRECDCGMRTYLKTSLKDKNPERRFFGCTRYPEQPYCNFFEWYDPPICALLAKHIADLKKQNKMLREQLRKRAAK